MLGDSSPSASPSNPKSKSHPSRATTSKANRAMDEDTEMDIEGVFSSGPGGSEAGEPEDMDSKSTSNSNSASRFFRAGGGAWVSANDPGPQPRSPSPFLSSETVDRANATSFRLLGERMALAERQYAQQYAGLYFIRLALLKKRVERAARRKWADLPGIYQINGTFVHLVEITDVCRGLQADRRPSWCLVSWTCRRTRSAT